MKFKRLLSLLLTVLLVFSSIPMMALNAETAEKTMIHLTDPGTRSGAIAKEVELTVGETYIFTFRHNFEEGGFGFGGKGTGVGVTLYAFNGNGLLADTNRSTWRESYDDRGPVYSVVDASQGLVSFKFTVAKHSWDSHSLYPATGTTAKFALGFHYNTRNQVTNLYVSDLAVYNVNDANKTNLFAEDTGDFTGWHVNWLEDSTKVGAMTGTSFDGGQNHFKAEVLPFDETRVSPAPAPIEEPATPSRMLHFKPFAGANADWEEGTAVLGQMISAKAGSRYYLSFNIATTAKDSLAIRGMENGNRKYIDVSPKLVEEVDHGSYYWMTYQITVPDNFAGESNGLILGVSLPGGSESYIFNMSAYDPYSADKANKYSNKTLETLDSFVYGAYLFWIPNYCWANKGGTINEEKTVWTYDYNNNTGLVEVMDYNPNAFSAFGVSEMAEPAMPSRMLHFKPFVGNNADGEEGTAVLGQAISAKAGDKYYVSFHIATNAKEGLTIKGMENEVRLYRDLSPELINEVKHDAYSWMTYEVTVPETYTGKGLIIGVSLPGGSESYIFNLNVYDPYAEVKTNKFGNKELNTLDGFVYGAYLFWIPNYCWSSKGGTINEAKTVWTYDYAGNNGVVAVMNFNAAILKEFNSPLIPEPAAPSRMLHFKPFNGFNADWEEGTAQLGRRVSITPGKTYYFAFGIATTVDVKKIALKAVCDNSARNDVNITYELVSVVDHPNYSWLTYSVTMPESIPSDANNAIFFGVSLPAGSESYIFNMNFYDPTSADKANKFGGSLNTLDGITYGRYIFWIPNYCWSSKGGTINEEKTVWTYDYNGNKGLVEVVDYSTKAFGALNKMLYFKYKNDQPIYTRTTLEAGTEYTFSFNVTNSVTSVGIVTKTDGDRNGINSNIKLVSAKDCGKFSSYKYSFTMPEDWVKGSAFVGVTFGSGDEGYLFNVKLAKADDATATQLMGNANFGSALSGWAYGWDAWFGVWGGNPADATEFYQNDVLKLKVCSYDESLWDDVVSPAMLHYSGTAGDGGSYIGQEVTLTKGNTYVVSFDYKELEGVLGEDYFVAIADSVNGRVGEILFDKDTLTEVSADSAKGVKYTFTLEGDAVADKATTDTYTLVFGSTSTADVYIGNLAMYDVNDATTTVLSKGNYVKNVYGYYSADAAAEDGATSFTSNGMTLAASAYNKGYFSTDKTMLHIKEYKVRGYDMFVQQIKGLEAGVEYTVSYKYHMVTGSLDVNNASYNSMVFGIFAGTNDPKSGSQVSNVNLYNDHATLGRKAAFTSTTDDGVTYTHTFTLNAEDLGSNDKLYAGFSTLPDPKIATEFYIADLVIYRSDDANKTNLFMSDDTETWVNNWYSFWGPSIGGNEIFSRSNIEYTAKYVPYDESLFTTPDAGVHYGDSNADGVLDLRDLVNLKKRLAEAKVALYAPVDLDNNKVVDSADVVALRKHFVGTEVIGEWADYTYNIEAAANLSGGADAAAANLKAAIEDYEDTVIDDYTGTIYYVAADGKSTNSGKTKDDPISIDAVNGLKDKFIGKLKAGDAVLFKRGDTFRISEAIDLEEGVGYGTYGTGAKPVILGSLRDYADASIWTADETGDIWSVELGTEDAGNIVFNNDTLVGVRKATFEELKVDGDFYYDIEAGKLYLFLSQVNPGNYFDNIEISTTRILLQDLSGNSSSNYSEDITVENLSLKYATVLGMDFNYSRNFYIAGCEIGWIGGAYFSDSGSRYGNGIQFWREADNCVVESNYIYQIFDAAVTFQGSVTNVYTELYFQTNLIEYCSMNFEFWGSSDDTTMDGIYFEENILRFGGYGFGGTQRPGYSYQGYILAGHHSYADEQIGTFSISNNIFDIANCNYVQATGMMDQLSFTGNTYYQNADSYFPIVYAGKYAKDADSLATAIKGTTEAPGYEPDALVNWVG